MRDNIFDRVRVGKTKYKYVSEMLTKGKKQCFRANVLNKSKFFETDKEAAIYVDTQLILAGKKPVNILKKV